MSNCTPNNCGDCDSPLTTQQPLVLNPACPTPQPCPTVSFTECVIYNGPNIDCLGLTTGMNFNEVLAAIAERFCEPPVTP
jgi:hypothetical protein